MEDWQITTIGETCTILNGYAFKSKDYVSRGGILNFRVTNIDWNGTVHVEDNVEYLPSNFEKTYKKYLLAHDDVIFVMVGATRGKLSQIPQHILPALMNQNMWRIVPVVKGLDKRYLYFYLRSKIDDLLKANEDQARGFFKKSDFKAISISLPPLPEQRKMAEVLGVVQRAMEQQERLLALTAELKKALLHKLFTEGLRGEPQKQNEIGPVPESWKERALEQAGDVVYGIQAAVAANMKPIGTKILTNKNITLDGKIIVDSINYFVLKTKRHHETLLKNGDLLFNWRSGSKEHVGKTAYFDLTGDFTHSSFILRIRPHDKVTGRFLFYYLNFLRESGYFVKAQTFSVNAKFNKSAINRLPTYLPSEDERREIVSALDAVTKKIAVVQTKRRLLEDLFRTLLHQLMTAQIRVHDLDLDVVECGDMSPHVTIRKV